MKASPCAADGCLQFRFLRILRMCGQPTKGMPPAVRISSQPFSCCMVDILRPPTTATIMREHFCCCFRSAWHRCVLYFLWQQQQQQQQQHRHHLIYGDAWTQAYVCVFVSSHMGTLLSTIVTLFQPNQKTQHACAAGCAALVVECAREGGSKPIPSALCYVMFLAFVWVCALAYSSSCPLCW
mmetsp:Transcript_22888/g.64837  ORF Transcript_22888/g.64837 Transcript_22888/m.64837 type:complete len:182 (+) Transcript_22888:1905-2450(+)